jgi:dihydroxyacetone kinase
MLDLCLKQDDPERSFVKFKDGDDLALLCNNQGGLSALEMGAVLDETLSQLGECFKRSDLSPTCLPHLSIPLY